MSLDSVKSDIQPYNIWKTHCISITKASCRMLFRKQSLSILRSIQTTSLRLQRAAGTTEYSK
jgi:hypothetical protein